VRASYLDYLSGLVGCCRSMSIGLAAKLAASQSLGMSFPGPDWMLAVRIPKDSVI
jgi:hypothetical protein